MSWDVVDLSQWRIRQQETEGDNEKQWYVEPATGERWLFKPNRPDRSRLEAHAEVIASRIAAALEIPAARVDLAIDSGLLGCVSRNVLSDKYNEELKPDQILATLVTDYDPRAKVRVGHNRANIVTVLRDCEPPRTVRDLPLSALDWFSSFLFFDALIGNVDRHSSNWSLERDWSAAEKRPGLKRLLPSFDHASSLGVSVRGVGLERLMNDSERLRQYPLKATAARFEDGAGVSLVDYAVSYLTECSPEGRRFIEQRFGQLPLEDIEGIITSGELSEPSTTLAKTVVRTNAERIRTCLKQR